MMLSKMMIADDTALLVRLFSSCPQTFGSSCWSLTLFPLIHSEDKNIRWDADGQLDCEHTQTQRNENCCLCFTNNTATNSFRRLLVHTRTLDAVWSRLRRLWWRMRGEHRGAPRWLLRPTSLAIKTCPQKTICVKNPPSLGLAGMRNILRASLDKSLPQTESGKSVTSPKTAGCGFHETSFCTAPALSYHLVA